MNTFGAFLALATLVSSADPKPTTRATAESYETNLSRYKKGESGSNAASLLGIEVNYPGDGTQGVTVVGFKTDSSAKAAGVEEFDWILEVDGSAVGYLRKRYYEPYLMYGRSGEKKSELLVSQLRDDGKRYYFYPFAQTATVITEYKYVIFPDDYFIVKKKRTAETAELRENNIARYTLDTTTENFKKYARFSLGVSVAYSYENGATVHGITPGGSVHNADIGLKVGDYILEVDGAPVGVFGDRTYEIWRQFAYNKSGVIEMLVCYKDPSSGKYRYYYPTVKLDKKTSDN